MTEDTLLEFPCRFPIKAMGRPDDGFLDRITDIVTRHAPNIDADAVQTTDSRAGRYVSVTVTITATSKAQLDSIYQDLSDCDQVLMTL